MNTKKPRPITYSHFFVTFAGTVLAATLLGCGSAKDVDKIGEAQNCLNSASATTAMDCVTKVDGITTVGAYNIRCAAAFVREGFANPVKYTTAFSSLNGSGTSSFMGLVSFSSTSNITTDAANASTTFGDCYAAGAKGKTLISAFGYFSTTLLKFFSDSAPTSTNCKTPTSGSYNLTTCLADVAANLPSGPLALIELAKATTTSASAAAVQTSIGSVIISTYNISCSGTGANKDLCATLKTPVTAGGSDPRAVFVSFFSSSVK